MLTYISQGYLFGRGSSLIYHSNKGVHEVWNQPHNSQVTTCLLFPHSTTLTISKHLWDKAIESMHKFYYVYVSNLRQIMHAKLGDFKFTLFHHYMNELTYPYLR